MAPGMCINRLSQGDFRTYKQKFPLKILETPVARNKKAGPGGVTFMVRPGPAFLAQAMALAEPTPRITEHSDPWRVFTPIGRVPRKLGGSEYTLGMGHEDSDPSIPCGNSGYARLGSVGVPWVTCGDLAAVIHVA